MMQTNHDFYKDFSPEERKLLQQIEVIEDYPSEQMIISIGERNRDILFIKSGTADIITTDISGQDKVIGEISSGEILGEMNFVIPLRRTASIRAKTHTSVIRYPYKSLCQLLLSEVYLGARFLKAINECQSIKLYHTLEMYCQKGIEKNTSQ